MIIIPDVHGRTFWKDAIESIKEGDTLQILTTERGETINTYSKVVSRKTQKRLGIMEKIKKLENGEEVDDEISNSYYESVLTNGNQDKGSDGYDKKIKKKKKGKRKKKKKGNESIKEEDENEEDVKEKRW